MFKSSKEKIRDIVKPEEKSDPLADYDVGDILGSFVGNIRRCSSKKEGLVAQIFGENGEDADMISAMHLTRFQDIFVKVSIWGLKDKFGALLSNREGDMPKITEFIAKVQRPSPSLYGQTALFFGQNGENADAINILNETKYLDALVHVDIQLAKESSRIDEIKTKEPTELLKQGIQRLTPEEVAAYKKQQEIYRKANDILLKSGFYKKDSILSAVGKNHEYEDWIVKQPCCMAEDHKACTNQAIAYNMHPGKYKAVPLCEDHAKMFDEGITLLSNPIHFIQVKRNFYNKEWAYETLKDILGVGHDEEIPPKELWGWAIENGIDDFPMSYLAYVNHN